MFSVGIRVQCRVSVSVKGVTVWGCLVFLLFPCVFW